MLAISFNVTVCASQQEIKLFFVPEPACEPGFWTLGSKIQAPKSTDARRSSRKPLFHVRVKANAFAHSFSTKKFQGKAHTRNQDEHLGREEQGASNGTSLEPVRGCLQA